MKCSEIVRVLGGKMAYELQVDGSGDFEIRHLLTDSR